MEYDRIARMRNMLRRPTRTVTERLEYTKHDTVAHWNMTHDTLKTTGKQNILRRTTPKAQGYWCGLIATACRLVTPTVRDWSIQLYAGKGAHEQLLASASTLQPRLIQNKLRAPYGWTHVSPNSSILEYTALHWEVQMHTSSARYIIRLTKIMTKPVQTESGS